MTNKQRQKELDEQKYLESETKRKDLSGDMPYCDYCACTTPYATCVASQEERETKCLCAKAFNKMRKEN